jgi:pimeloyl-ACP methyl ester carboxylesterase
LEVPKTKVGDIQLYYEEHGRGEPLLLIMGLGASTLSWAEQIPAFAREFRVIAFDNRGAGRSDKPDGHYSIALFAEDTAGLMDALAIDAAHVYGQSMGGFIAQELALRHPQRVRTLVLGSTSCGGRHAVAGSPENLAIFGSINALTPQQAAEKGLPLLYSEEFIARQRGALIERSLREAELRPPPDAFGRQVQAAIRHNSFDRLADIRCPCLVITGSDDKIVPADNSLVLTQQIPHAELAVLPDAGHGYLMEKAEESNAIVSDFLRRHRLEANEPAVLQKGSLPGSP